MKSNYLAAIAASFALAPALAMAAPVGLDAFGPNEQFESFENFVPAGQPGVRVQSQNITFASGVTLVPSGFTTGIQELANQTPSGCYGISYGAGAFPDGTAAICTNTFTTPQTGALTGLEFILPVNAIRAGAYVDTTGSAGTIIIQARDANGQVLEERRIADPAGIDNISNNFFGIDVGAPNINSIFISSVESLGLIIDRVTFEGPADMAPTANAGDDQSVRMLGETVTLDGSASFDDNTASGDLQYAWQLTGKPAGSAGALTGASTAMPSFVADAAGTYTASLVVTDSIGQASPADEVTVSTANLAPTADAGPNRVGLVNDVIVLDGSGSSDPEGMALNYAWSLDNVPAGSNAVLANTNSVSPNLIPDRAGLYGVSLVVSDNLGPSDPDTAEITVLTRSDFASMKIACAADLIADLPESAVKTKGNQKALLNYLGAAAKAVQRPDYEKAVERIEFTLKRADGCFVNGVADGNGVSRDWVEECGAQLEIYRCLDQARTALQP
ncbi:PKD domain-containing protein [Marinicaulis aureus]|uniref:PKD domain-containing protein n=1 Tax=Hyphococcus aureus TaxID=2666033 RepID=A0ABW1L1W7_9PROT